MASFPTTDVTELGGPSGSNPKGAYPLFQPLVNVLMQVEASDANYSPENRLARVMDSRTETLRELLNAITAELNAIQEAFLPRDGATDEAYMRGALDLGLNRIINLAQGAEAADLITKEQLDDLLAEANLTLAPFTTSDVLVKASGEDEMTGDLDMGNQRLVNVNDSEDVNLVPLAAREDLSYGVSPVLLPGWQYTGTPAPVLLDTNVAAGPDGKNTLDHFRFPASSGGGVLRFRWSSPEFAVDDIFTASYHVIVADAVGDLTARINMDDGVHEVTVPGDGNLYRVNATLTHVGWDWFDFQVISPGDDREIFIGAVQFQRGSSMSDYEGPDVVVSPALTTKGTVDSRTALFQSNYVERSDGSMAADLPMNNQVIKNLGDAAGAEHLATKSQADALNAQQPQKTPSAAYESDAYFADIEAGTRVPVGSIFPYAGSAIPTADWVLCDGTLFSSSQYPELYEFLYNFGSDLFQLGTTIIDGVTYIRLPDLRGRALQMTDTSTQVAGYDGSEQAVMDENHLPVHDHDYEDATYGGGSGPDVTVGPSLDSNNQLSDFFPPKNTGGGGTVANPDAAEEQTANLGGSTDRGHYNVQPSIAVNFIIRARP